MMIGRICIFPLLSELVHPERISDPRCQDERYMPLGKQKERKQTKAIAETSDNTKPIR